VQGVRRLVDKVTPRGPKSLRREEVHSSCPRVVPARCGIAEQVVVLDMDRDLCSLYSNIFIKYRLESILFDLLIWDNKVSSPYYPHVHVYL